MVSHLAPVGRLEGSQRLNLSIGLPLRNQEALANLLRQLSDPSSPSYRRYLTPAQFTERFGPSESDYQAVINFAQSHGLKITATHPNRMIVDVEGAVSDIENTFHVTMRSYQHPTEARRFYAPDTAPSVDLTVPVLSVSGLDNYSLPHPRLLIRAGNSNSKAYPALPNPGGLSPSPNSGSGPRGNYMGNDFRAAYAPNVSQTGTGQTVGLLEFDGYTTGDITYYESEAGLRNVPLTNVLLDGFSGNPTGDGGEVEVSLDIEMAISMAPGASSVIVYEAGPYGNWHDILNRIATDNLAKQISCSWYAPDAPADPTADQIFQQMAVQGQSFFAASGDDDAYTGLIPFPEDTPYITEVGGTTLTTSSAGGPWSSETVWNWNDGNGSGGGISTQYSIPSWQRGISMTVNQGSATMRNVPDVALTADNVYVRADGEDWSVGGTSCAAPLWAAFIALVNQQTVANNETTVGFINPTIYAIGQEANYASDFHDITTGNNFSTSSPTRFSAVTGYDLCTGWGTPNGAALINALVSALGPVITTGSPLPPGAAGAAYDQTLTASGGASPYSWSISSGSLPAGLNLSNGGVISGTPTASGTVNFTVEVTDSNRISSTAAFSLQIYAEGTPIIATSSPLPQGTAGAAYNQTLTASGGTTPYTWSIASGSLPAGLSLSSTGVISGTPATAGSATFTVQVTGNNGLSSTTAFSLTINPPLTITTSSPLPSGSVGRAYSQTLAASGGVTPYTWSIANGSLPAGLSLNSAGVISGTPISLGTASFTAQVTDNNGLSSTAVFSLTINLPLTITTSNPLPSGGLGTAYSQTLAASGGVTPYTWSIANGSLPAGLSLSSAGVISGTPTSVGTASFTVQVTGADGGFCTAAFSLTITLAPPTWGRQPNWPTSGYGVPYSNPGNTVSGLTRICGADSFTTNGSEIVTGGGVDNHNVHQLPLVVSGDFTASYEVMQTEQLSWRVGWAIFDANDACALIIQSQSGAPNTYLYMYDIVDDLSSYTGGAPDYTFDSAGADLGANTWHTVTLQRIGSVLYFSVDSTLAEVCDLGSIPDLNLGLYNFEDGQTWYFRNISVTQPPTPIITTTSPLPGGAVAASYSQTLMASGGTPPYTWSIASGSLPAGLSLSSGGVISGTPTVAGTFSFTAQVTDSNSMSATATFSLTIYPQGTPIIATSSPLPQGTAGAAYNQTLTASGGTTPYTWSIASGSLPAGLSLSSTGVISGTPTTAGTANFTVQVTDSDGLSSTAPFILTVNPPPTITTGSPLPSGGVGTAYNQTLAASGGTTPYTWSLSSGSLPVGLSLSTSGAIGGTPTTAGTATFTVQVADANQATATQTFSLTIQPPPPIITSATGATAVDGTSYSYQITATNNPTSFGASGLPAGLSVNTSTGLISGTPSASGDFNVTISATGSGGTTTATLSMAVYASPLPFPNPLPPTALIPPLSSYTVPGYLTVSASSEYWNLAQHYGLNFYSTYAWAAFLDQTDVPNDPGPVDGQWTSDGVPTPSSPQWLQISFNNPTVVNAYSLYDPSDYDSNNPTTWIFQASNDGQNWTSLDTHTGYQWPRAGASITFSFTNTTTYTYYRFYITADNGDGNGVALIEAELYGPNSPLPFITSSPTATGIAGTAFSYQITATNNPTSYGATGLPAGLSVNPTTGLISGTPTVDGMYNAAISATNSYGSCGAALTITIDQAPAITNGPPPATATTGIAYNFTYTATGYPAPTFTLLSGSLPPGLTLSSPGVISGTPTAPGTYSGTVDAGNGLSPDATQAFTIIVTAATPPVITNGPPPTTASAGASYSFTYTATGYPTPTFSVTAGALPTGLTLSSSGVISGTLTAPGTYTGTITARNSAGTATQNFSITVQQAPGITNGPPPVTASIGIAYNFTYTAIGYPTPIFSVTAGALPTGLTLSSSGVISGTPTATGTYTGTVTASNGVGTAATQNFTITAQPYSGPPIITSAKGATAVDGISYSYQITATSNPTSFGASGLPAGLSVNTSTGLIGGIPTASDDFNVTISATGSGGTTTATLSMAVYASPLPSPNPLPSTALIPPLSSYTAPDYLTVSASSEYWNLAQHYGLNFFTTYAWGAFLDQTYVPKDTSKTSGQWISNGVPTPSSPQWLQISFNNPTVVNAYSLYDPSDYDSNNPRTWIFQASHDGQSWTSLDTHTGYQWSKAGASITFPFTNTTAYTYYRFYITADNGDGNGVGLIESELYGPNPPLPIITSSPTATGIAGTAFSYQITATATNSPTSYGATGLPAGLSVNTTTGLISGTPITGGVYNVTISATNSNGRGTANLTVTVQQAPSLTNGPPPAAIYNSAYSFTYTTSGYPVPTFSIISGSLPPGLTLSPAGVISGIPTATGTHTGTVEASNGINPAATQNFSITVDSLSTYTSWASQYFTEQQMSNPAISGPTATPQNDGVPNLLKYLFDINPAEVMSATDIAALPAVGMTTSGGASYLTLTYRENPTISGITINVQTSADLQTWTTVTDPTIVQIGTDPNRDDPIMQVQIPFAGTGEFIRLNVTSP
ncbi:MAG TPA: putative Ig domain-containing protein [Candidatus Methylacidiphilales bacterium]|nr:putative Ig domain-containing protein [Candidatus Methylacidiphilales bacterium]